MIVADSSPVIILAKQGLLGLLKKCFNKVVIPKSVHEEVMQKSGSPEAIAIAKAIAEKWVSVQKAAVIDGLNTKNIGLGEKEAISLAYNHKSLLIIDDDSAKRYASLFGVEAHGSLFVIYLACARKLIGKTDAVKILENMISDGFYISSELYSRFVSLLDAIK